MGRRMLSSKITNLNEFIGLSAAAQALYMHLCIASDDEGFSSELALSLFKAHAGDDDLQALIKAGLIYKFESSVILIRHWFQQNTTRKDRWKETQFVSERAMVRLDEDNVYELVPDGGHAVDTRLSDGCQMVASRLPDGCQMGGSWSPKDNINKDNINKYNINKYKEREIRERSEGELPDLPNDVPNALSTPEDVDVDEKVVKMPDLKDGSIDYQELVDRYNRSMGRDMSKCTVITPKRKKLIDKCIKQYGNDLDFYQKIFETVKLSNFLCGDNDKHWVATFDWIMQVDSIAKILEGNYINRPRYSRDPPSQAWKQAYDAFDYGLKEYRV